MAASKALVIDDDISLLKLMTMILKSAELGVVIAEDGTQGLMRISEEVFDVVLVDLVMEGIDGMDVLRQVKAKYPEIPVIVMTAHPTFDTVLDSLREGAYDYVAKPFNHEELLLTVRRALEKTTLTRENRLLRFQVRERYSYSNIIGASVGMRQVFEMIERLANSDVTCLIQGDSGTGKELVARAIHYNGQRSGGPFVVVNCAALPEQLVESELFGHEKGAFTGAHQQKRGRFELADKGSIFLDEIGELQPSTQAKLLRVIQERSFDRVGGNATIDTDVRVIAATNRHLTEDVQKGAFREDLYYRLSVVPIQIPSLRERKDDIPLLIRHFLEELRERGSTGVHHVTPEAMQLLTAHDWPGNVRELENCVERIAIMADGDVALPEHLPPEILSASVSLPQNDIKLPLSLPDYLDDIEKRLIVEALEQANGVQAEAARLLDVSKNTLAYKINKHQIPRSQTTETRA